MNEQMNELMNNRSYWLGRDKLWQEMENFWDDASAVIVGEGAKPFALTIEHFSSLLHYTVCI